MQPLLSTPGEFLAPTPLGNQPTGSLSIGEESFSQHLANETARESTDSLETALAEGREMAGNVPLLNQRVLETEAQLLMAGNNVNPTNQVLEAQQSKLLNTQAQSLLLDTQVELQPLDAQILSGENNKAASPLMVLLDKLSTQKSVTSPLAGDAQSTSPISAPQKNASQPEGVNAQPQKASALQQQLAALSEILTPAQPAATSANNDTPQSMSQAVIYTASELTQPRSTLSPIATPSFPGNESSSSVVVEQWSATYKPIQTQPTNPENTTAVSATPVGENVIKTENGQTITIYQSSDNEEMAVTNPLAGRPSTVDQSGQRQDANSNYIHSNLPSNTGKTALGAGGEQQAKSGGEQQPDPKNMSTSTELTAETRLSKDTAPVPFTLDSVVAAASAPTSPTTSPGTGLMKLPSGATFQQSAVVDQVINHFSGAQKLESGSIRLQLHPQELGELRMEIEVKQDNVKAHITAQNPQAQEALERHLPRLRETLAQQGLHLNNVEISVAAGEQYDGNHFQQNNARHQLGKSYRLGNVSTTGMAASTDEEPSLVNESQQSLSVTV